MKSLTHYVGAYCPKRIESAEIDANGYTVIRVTKDPKKVTCNWCGPYAREALPHPNHEQTSRESPKPAGEFVQCPVCSYELGSTVCRLSH